MTLLSFILRRWPAALALAVPLMLQAAAARPVPAAEIEYGQGLLWRIEAPGVAPNYLFGTIHVTDERVLDLPAPVRKAFAMATSATFEVIMTDEDRAKMGQAMVLDDGRDLEAILGPELFQATVAAGRRYGFEAAQLRRFKPWALATIFSIPQAELARTSGGDQPLDQWLQGEAARQGKAVHALETPAEQLALFNDLSQADQVAMLASAVEANETIETMFEEMTRDYLARHVGAIYARMEAQARAQDAQGAFVRLFLERFNLARNETMAARMAARLDGGGAFIAIGALHLPGEAGLLSLLAARGYKVSRAY